MQEILQIENESIIFTKKLELCSEICSNSMNKFKDMGKPNDVAIAIVFIHSSFNTIEDTLINSLKHHNVLLDYKLIDIDSYELNSFKDDSKQLFIVTDHLRSIDQLSKLNKEFLVIDFKDNSFYIDLIAKNIKKYTKFDISNISMEV